MSQVCYALLRMRPLSISCAGFAVISRGKVIMTNLAGETIDARCVDCIYIDCIYIYIYVRPRNVVFLYHQI
jgi:hypothetical protein